MHCRENFTITLSDYENYKKGQIWKDNLCKLVGRLLGGPGKERHDQGGFFEALGLFYKREKVEKKKGEAKSKEHKSLVDEKGV